MSLRHYFHNTSFYFEASIYTMEGSGLPRMRKTLHTLLWTAVKIVSHIHVCIVTQRRLRCFSSSCFSRGFLFIFLVAFSSCYSIKAIEKGWNLQKAKWLASLQLQEAAWQLSWGW